MCIISAKPRVRNTIKYIILLPLNTSKYHWETKQQLSINESSDRIGLSWVYVKHVNAELYQWLFLVPLKGGIGSIQPPRFGKDYKWYISGISNLPIGGWTMPPTVDGWNPAPPGMYFFFLILPCTLLLQPLKLKKRKQKCACWRRHQELWQLWCFMYKLSEGHWVCDLGVVWKKVVDG